MAVAEILLFAERVRKATLAFYTAAGVYAGVLATQDLSTVEGVIGAVVVILQTAGVYSVTNR